MESASPVASSGFGGSAHFDRLARLAGSAGAFAHARMDSRIVEVGLAQPRELLHQLAVGCAFADGGFDPGERDAGPAEYRFTVEDGEIGGNAALAPEKSRGVPGEHLAKGSAKDGIRDGAGAEEKLLALGLPIEAR